MRMGRIHQREQWRDGSSHSHLIQEGVAIASPHLSLDLGHEDESPQRGFNQGRQLGPVLGEEICQR